MPTSQQKKEPIEWTIIRKREWINNGITACIRPVNIPEAIELVKEVEQYIDVVEIGTPVVINEGLRAVKEIKEAFPQLKVLADLKIMDAGGYEIMKASEAGADIITVLGATDDATIKGAVEEAKNKRRKS